MYRLLKLRLKLHSDDGQAIDKQYDIDTIALSGFAVTVARASAFSTTDMRAIHHLWHNTADIRLVTGNDIRIKIVFRLELT